MSINSNRLLRVILGVPLLGFGLVILLGAAVRLGGGGLTMPVFTFIVVTLVAGVLPAATGFLLIIKSSGKK